MASSEPLLSSLRPKALAETLPRDAPFWLSLQDEASSLEPTATADAGDADAGDPNLIWAARQKRSEAPLPSLALALSCLPASSLVATYGLEAAALLKQRFPEHYVEYLDDTHWRLFPEVGAALQRLASREECLCAAVCTSSGHWAFGVSMARHVRFDCAMAALAISLALKPDGSGLEILAPYPHLARLAWRARGARWAPLRTALLAGAAEAAQALRSRGAALRIRCNARRCAGRAARRPREQLRVASPCDGSAVHWARRADEDSWSSFCVCCKRPLSLSFVEAPAEHSQRQGRERCAYVCALWGKDPQHILGAMVLGHSLRRTRTPHDLVVLHTSDVPLGALTLLRRVGWHPVPVDHVQASEKLFANPTNRFAGVFTKLRVFGLVEYSKVLLLDSDLLVQESIDDVFELSAPAAMHRGVRCGYKHGEPIDGRFFFGGSRPGYDYHSPYWSSPESWGETVHGPWSWGQATGINAGVMLFRPDLETLKLCLSEVTDGTHPEHIPGGGPEQDYLSRFFAGEWRHISVAYNFQLHQMYFLFRVLTESDECSADRLEFLQRPDSIKVFHYSGDPKPWARRLDPRLSTFSDAEWHQELLGRFAGYRQFILKDPEYVEAEQIAELPQWAIDGSNAVVQLAFRLWDEAYDELCGELSEPELAECVVQACGAVAEAEPSARAEELSKDSRTLELSASCSPW